MYRTTRNRHRDDDSIHFAIFTIRDANSIEIENRFSYMALYMFIQMLNCSLGKHSQYLRGWLGLSGSWDIDHLIERFTTNECIHPRVTEIWN
jgi:hypothetical protein